MWIADSNCNEAAAGRHYHQSTGETQRADHPSLDSERSGVACQEPCSADCKRAGEPEVGRASEEDIEGVKHLDETA